MPVVLNKRNLGNGHVPPGSIYCGRPSKYGNPFMMGRDGDRDDVVNKHMYWIVEGKGRKLLKGLSELKGHDLVCFCAPLACHCNFLLSLANDDELRDFVIAYPSVKAMLEWIDAGRPAWQPEEGA